MENEMKNTQCKMSNAQWQWSRRD